MVKVTLYVSLFLLQAAILFIPTVTVGCSIGIHLGYQDS